MNSAKNDHIVYLRALACIFVFLCHLVALSEIAAVQMLELFFNVGVQLFLIISAALYGQKEIKKPFGKWLFSRMIKLLVPMYVALTAVIIGNLLSNNTLSIFQIIAYVLNLQAFLAEKIRGAEHFWYLSIAMLCYLITPLLQKYKKSIAGKLTVITVAFLLAQILLAFVLPWRFAWMLILVLLYIFAYAVGANWDKITTKLSSKALVFNIALTAVAIVLRFLGKIFFDETVFYEAFIVGYTHFALSFGMFFIMAYICKKTEGKKIPSVIKYVNYYSYEFYLVHYMFCIGPFSLCVTNSFVINCLIIIAASVLSAVILKYLCKLIFKPLKLKYN